MGGSPNGSPSSSPASSFSALPEADRAPLGSGASLYDPSVDGTSISADPGDGPRPEKPEDVPQVDKDAALEIKSRANKCFSASQYQEALDLYTLSLNRNPFDATVWCNRAAVRLKREEHGLAIMDTSKAIELDPKYVKAYFRRATAQISIVKPKEALKDFKKCLALDPKNSAARIQHEATSKLVRRMEFEKAIASSEEEPSSSKVLKMISDGACEVDPTYSGPKLDLVDGRYRPTQGFVEGTLAWFKEGKLLPRRYVFEIVLGVREVLMKEESMTEYTVPEGETCDVVGDTHGQFFDVLHLLTLTGFPSSTHALVFNGDFVDRGSWSTEVVLTVFLLKWLWPSKIFLNRGNHETADLNKVYGFEGETKKKYSELTYKLFEETFTALPLACLVSASQKPRPTASSIPKEPTILSSTGHKRFYIVHGGLFSRDGVSLDEVRQIPRLQRKQPGQEGLMMEALWTDPQDGPGRGPSKRGVGLGFGPDVTKAWCEHVKVTAVIRSHEVREEGYTIEHEGRCITVFSAPNYVDQVGNKAAFIRIDDAGELKFTQYTAQPHPPIKPMAYSMSPLGMGGFM